MASDFDIIVVGGGHAGVEAALAAARMGKSAAIVTMDRRKLALMSCNPAIGGIGKSHIVKEIDALGGVMAEATDATGIQFRRLNLSRGPAVWSTRVQCDRRDYTAFISDFVAAQAGIEVIEGIATQLVVVGRRVMGVRTKDGKEIVSRTVLLSTGTFLGGLIHIGHVRTEAGRMGEPAAIGMTDSLIEHGFEVKRMKTGTPPRLDGDTIDFSKCSVQPGDMPIPWFSHRSRPRDLEQVPCHLTYTSEETKSFVSRYSHRSPIFSGQITAKGPRYCPSIEDKFVRFPDKERHQIFLEPEGNGTNEIYPNGFSTALPELLQRKAIKTIIGLEEVEITRPGYAIEYDYCPTHQIDSSLQTRLLDGLFFAGQINGTSGYEEAAGQGIIAGINAALWIDGEPPLVLDRASSYIGVMIDDLCTRTITEPYRMFTSRAEYRLALREDNARDRLAEIAGRYGLVDSSEMTRFRETQSETEAAAKRYSEIRVKISELGSLGDRFQKTEQTTLENLLRQPNVDIAAGKELVARFDNGNSDSPEVVERAIVSIMYQGYIDKQQREIESYRRMESMAIPDDFVYSAAHGLKTEAQEKLEQFRPASLGQAGRIEGVTPGDIAVLSVYLKKHMESRHD